MKVGSRGERTGAGSPGYPRFPCLVGLRTLGNAGPSPRKMTAHKPIYMDYSATTPCDPRVVERMGPFFSEQFGNAASKSHAYGWEAESAVEQAREQVAALIGAHPKEILWTSGSTESNNLALKGAAEMFRPKGNQIISCRTEHRAVSDPLADLVQKGFEVTWLPVDGTGRIDTEELRAAIGDQTVLISLMIANNEGRHDAAFRTIRYLATLVSTPYSQLKIRWQTSLPLDTARPLTEDGPIYSR